MKRVLVGCERSGVVRRAFRKVGTESFSNDLVKADDHSGWHFTMDVEEAIKTKGAWDLIILHPPCTALAVSGNAHYGRGKSLFQKRQSAIKWTIDLWNLAKEHANHVALENPVGVLGSNGLRPTQYIQPFNFGHPESKKTGLWLHNLPKLESTNVLDLPECGYWENQTPSGQNKLVPSPDRARLRGITYQGIADAMANQWGPHVKIS